MSPLRVFAATGLTVFLLGNSVWAAEGPHYFSLVVAEKNISEGSKTTLDVVKAVTRTSSETDAKKYEAVRKAELEKDGYRIVQARISNDESYEKLFAEGTAEPTEQYPIRMDAAVRLWDKVRQE